MRISERVRDSCSAEDAIAGFDAVPDVFTLFSDPESDPAFGKFQIFGVST